VIVADRAEGARKRVEAAAKRAGAFVEFEDTPPTSLPFPDDDFNIVVANHRLSSLNDADRVQCLVELHRVLKPGGRAVAVEAAARPGFLGILPGRAAAISIADLQAAFERAGWRTPRELATKSGVLYLEALKPRTT
jgi:ubiquinone/menaquinone biosynthesis C-methylase UbiE